MNRSVVSCIQQNALQHHNIAQMSTCCHYPPPCTSGWLPLSQCGRVRHMSKSVTRHRRPMHIIKQKLLAVTEYIPPRRVAAGAYPSQDKKVEVVSDTEPAGLRESGLVLLLKKEVKKVFEDCKMIAVLQNNASNSEDMLTLRHRLHKHSLTVKFFPNEVIRTFLKDSQYCNMAPLFIGQTVLIVSKQGKVKEMLSTLRGSPQMVLLGACIDGTLLSAQGVQHYAKLPSVTTVQGELVSGLTMLTSRTASMLQHHPAHLSALLRQYVRQQEAPAAEPGAKAGEGEGAVA
ncbi:39S ribosomal protein L10, mitochondrial [Merluccius polli]|uniref:Large ribosomal subunit protein uL10m n=1 Tax=Merluccius polli TaxID=89951 RepID=A0AA47N6E1_MERPO|nr:39S ribosomal protein L10, mitochondrial [Merluccius polli]